MNNNNNKIQTNPKQSQSQTPNPKTKPIPLFSINNQKEKRFSEKIQGCSVLWNFWVGNIFSFPIE